MPEIPGFSCDHEALRREVVEWLIDSRMSFPAGFLVHLEVADVVPDVEDNRTVFAQSDVDIRAGEPLGWVHLTWQRAPAWARIESDRPEARIVVSPAALEHTEDLLRRFLLIVLIFIWKRDGKYHIHAGTAIDPGGRGWLLIGDSHSGKSTTTALLASRGWQVGTDDIGFLVRAGERAGVTGFRSPIALRPGGFELLGRTGGIPMPARAKTGFWAEQLGAPWVQTVEPDIVVFTSIGGDRTRFTPVAPVTILKGLLHRSLWVMFETTGAEEHLDLIGRLGRQSQCYQATIAPDIFAAPRALEEFLP
jgi:hypothetical protein